MTTSPVRVVREPADAWANLRRVGLSHEHAVLSFIVRDDRRASSIDLAGRTLAVSLGRSATTIPDLLVVAHLGTVDTSSKLNRYRLEKEGPWWLAGAASFVSVPGNRQAWLEPAAGQTKNAAYGSIQIEPDELPHALATTRGLDAAVVGIPPASSPDDVLREIAVRGPGVFESATTLVPASAVFAARGFGVFDDRESGVDVVAMSSFLDELAAASN